MNLVTTLFQENDYNFLKESPIGEFLIATRDFSSLGSLSLDSAENLILKIRNDGKKDILLIDTLLTENDFLPKIFLIKNFIIKNNIHTVRVQDIGIFEFILQEFKNVKIELALKTGHHNLKSIQNWIKYGNGQVSKIVLSPELSRDVIKNYINEISIPVEVYAFGRILIFHSPRSLLKKDQDEFSHLGEIWASGKSEESPHQGFRILENNRGTFMFHPKKLSILEYKDELIQMNVGGVHVDFYPLVNAETVKLFSDYFELSDKNLLSKLKDFYGETFIRGFYLGNKTDVLFSKLKVPMAHRDNNDFLGEIIEVHKNRLIALKLVSKEKKLVIGDKLLFFTPEGKKQTLTVKEMKNIKLAPVEVANKDDIIYLRYVRGVVPRTNVFLDVGEDENHGV